MTRVNLVRFERLVRHLLGQVYLVTGANVCGQFHCPRMGQIRSLSEANQLHMIHMQSNFHTKRSVFFIESFSEVTWIGQVVHIRFVFNRAALLVVITCIVLQWPIYENWNKANRNVKWTACVFLFGIDWPISGGIVLAVPFFIRQDWIEIQPYFWMKIVRYFGPQFVSLRHHQELISR